MNKLIDHPGVMSHAIHSLTNNSTMPEFARFGPDRIGHRKYGHDIAQSSLLALASGAGVDGILAMWSHLMGDMMHDTLRRSIGSTGAYAFEANYNYLMSQGRKKRSRTF